MKNILYTLLFLIIAAAIFIPYFRNKYKKIETNRVVDAYNSLTFRSDGVNETFNQLIRKETTDKLRFEQECLKANFYCKEYKEKFKDATIQMKSTPYNQQAKLVIEFATVFQSQIIDMQEYVNSMPNGDLNLIAKIEEKEIKKDAISTQILKFNK